MIGQQDGHVLKWGTGAPRRRRRLLLAGHLGLLITITVSLAFEAVIAIHVFVGLAVRWKVGRFVRSATTPNY